MADVALRRFQLGLEGPYTTGNGPLSSTQASIYNATGANIGANGAIGTSGSPPYPATRRLSIEKGVGADFEYVWEAPVEARGTYAGGYQHILHEVSVKGKLPAFVYADDLSWYGKMLFSGTPAVTTLPGTAVTVLAATAISAGAVSIAGIVQPTNPQIIGVTYANGTSSATAITVTITGTVGGVAGQTDTITFPAGTQSIWYNATGGTVGGVTAQAWQTSTNAATATTATFYSKQYFTAITGIAASSTPTGTPTIALVGVNAFQWVFPLDMSTSTLYSATGEYYDGTGAWQIPGMVAEKYTLTASIGKSLKTDISFVAKNKLQLVAYAANNAVAAPALGLGYTPGSISATAAQGTQSTLGNLADNVFPAIPTYVTRVYAGNIGTTVAGTSLPAGMTQISARITDYKFDLDNKVKLGKAADGTANPNFVGRDYYGQSLNASMTLLFNNATAGSLDPTEVQQFLNQQSRVVRVSFPGVALPCNALTVAGGWDYSLQDSSGHGGYYGIILDLAGKYTKMTEKDVDGRMAMDFELQSEVDLTTMGVPAQMTLVNRQAPAAVF